MAEQSSKDAEMSSVIEMNGLVHEAADYAAPHGNWKERVTAAARAFDLGWERARAFYYREARRVDAEEMDRARQEIQRLRANVRNAKHREHLEWLACEIGRLRSSGEELHGPHVDGLEHFLRLAGGADGTLAVSDEGQVKTTD